MEVVTKINGLLRLCREWGSGAEAGFMERDWKRNLGRSSSKNSIVDGEESSDSIQKWDTGHLRKCIELGKITLSPQGFNQCRVAHKSKG